MFWLQLVWVDTRTQTWIKINHIQFIFSLNYKVKPHNFWTKFGNYDHSGLYRKLLSYKALDEQLRKPVDFKPSRVVTIILGLWSLIHCKVHIFWEIHKNLKKKIPNIFDVIRYLVMTNKIGRFFQIVWPFQNIWTLYITSK